MTSIQEKIIKPKLGKSSEQLNLERYGCLKHRNEACGLVRFVQHRVPKVTPQTHS